jgi:hypothetical protein
MKRNRVAQLRTIEMYGRSDFKNPLMCVFVSKFAQAQRIHDLEHGRVERIATEGAFKIPLLLERGKG